MNGLVKCLTSAFAAGAMLAATAMTGQAQPAIPAQPAAAPSFVNTLMPEPAHLAVNSGILPLKPGFTISTDKFDNERLDEAISRIARQISFDVGFVVSPAAQGTPGSLVVSVDGAGEAIQSPDEDESYTLDVTSQGAHLHAATVVGAMRGLETLLQLVQSSPTGFFLPAVSIQDSPRFRWRGLMIDCSRHFEPIPVIERTLDAMAAVKMNVFHWHLSDDQGFRMQSKVFPKLTAVGSNGEFYTQDQAREIVAYAAARGIRVVPEFDMPGHSTAMAAAYPELASAEGPFSVGHNFGGYEATLDPTKKSTYKFLDKFVGEMSKIFPDEYFHIGGDEVVPTEWNQNPDIQKFMQKHDLRNPAALQAYFNQQLLKILQKHHKKMIGWDEILTPGLPKDIVVQSWRGFGSLAAGAQQGYSGILSAGYYLDHMDSAAAHYEVDPVPANSNLTPEQAARILGGEACMWGEYTGPRNIDSRIWPRTAAIAERLWSPQSVNNVDDMYRRLWIESLRIEQLGLTQISQEDASLRALAGTDQIEPLQTLAAFLEPVNFDTRAGWSESHGVTTLDPQDHIVDAIPPDPPSRHDFAGLVSNYLQDPAARPDQQAALNAIFRSWVTNEADLLTIVSQSPLLSNALPRAEQLPQLGALGMQAISYLASGVPAPPGWKQSQLAILDSAQQPVALTEFTVLQPLRDLVNEVK